MIRVDRKQTKLGYPQEDSNPQPKTKHTTNYTTLPINKNKLIINLRIYLKLSHLSFRKKRIFNKTSFRKK